MRLARCSWPAAISTGGTRPRQLLPNKQLSMSQLFPAEDRPQAAAAAPELRHNCLSLFENMAQTLGVLAPSGTISVIIPLVILSAGNGTWLLLLIVLAVLVPIVWSVLRFAGLYASAGSLAAFIRLGLGTRGGLVAGWIYLFGMIYCVPGALLVSAAYLDILLIPWLGPAGSAVRVEVLTALVTGAAWAAAQRDIRLSTHLMIAIEASSVLLMVALMLAGMWHAGAWVDRPQLHLTGVNFSGMQGGLVLAFLLMGGFESATSLGEEAQDPRRTIPRAIFVCMLPLGLLYLLMTYAMVALEHRGVIGGQINDLTIPFDNIARALGLPWLGALSTLAVALSYFACGLGSLTVGSRVLFSMARDGWFWRAFGEAHPRNQTPHRAIALIALIAMAAPILMLARGAGLGLSINFLSQLGSLGLIGGYLLVVLALPFYLRRLGQLRGRDVALALGGLAPLGLVLFFSVYPVPPAPYCYLAYIFLGSAWLGVGVSWVVRRQRFAEALA
jgi:amino acid transporter